jgi:addiction module RelE/StbE family toxin
MRLEWRPEARSDLRRIVSYFRDDNPIAATRMLSLIGAATEKLPGHPYAFRAGRLAETRELVVHPNYIVINRELSDCVEIVGVLHAHREYP